jgi:hypothetical protein
MQRRVDFRIADLRGRRSPNRCSILAFSPNFHQNPLARPLALSSPRAFQPEAYPPPAATPASLETRARQLAFRAPDGIRAVARMPVLAIRPPRTPAPRRPLDPAAASHDLQQSRCGIDQLQPYPGWVAERFKAPVLKFDGGRAVPSPYVPRRVRFQCFRGRHDPSRHASFRPVAGRLGPNLGPSNSLWATFLPAGRIGSVDHTRSFNA